MKTVVECSRSNVTSLAYTHNGCKQKSGDIHTWHSGNLEKSMRADHNKSNRRNQKSERCVADVRFRGGDQAKEDHFEKYSERG